MASGQLFVYLVQVAEVQAVAMQCYVRSQGDTEMRHIMVMLQL